MTTEQDWYHPLPEPEREPLARLHRLADEDLDDPPVQRFDWGGAHTGGFPVVAGGDPAPGGWVAAAMAVRWRRPSPRALVAAGVAVAILTIGWQGWQVHRLNDRLTAADDRFGAALAAEQARGAVAEARTEDLERAARRAFNSEAIATAVLPSVFRVRAGEFTGTAFAVGNKAVQGSTNLLTNYHVIASVWEAGDREVELERGDVDVTATVVRVDEDEDLAQLRMDRSSLGLAAAPEPTKSGQPVVVVGAPLGLEDTVTTGVISALRTEASGRRIQFDAPINPGNSGGPVINSAKQVVGLATAKARDAEGIGLAIPIATACDTFDVC